MKLSWERDTSVTHAHPHRTARRPRKSLEGPPFGGPGPNRDIHHTNRSQRSRDSSACAESPGREGLGALNSRTVRRGGDAPWKSRVPNASRSRRPTRKPPPVPTVVLSSGDVLIAPTTTRAVPSAPSPTNPSTPESQTTLPIPPRAPTAENSHPSSAPPCSTRKTAFVSKARSPGTL